jgi:hypothetical protein
MFLHQTNNIAQNTYDERLTLQDFQRLTKEQLEGDRSDLGYTTLYCAVMRYAVEVVEIIIDKGVDVNGKSSRSEWTPLMGSAWHEKWDTLKYLVLKCGADVRLLNWVRRYFFVCFVHHDMELLANN